MLSTNASYFLTFSSGFIMTTISINDSSFNQTNDTDSSSDIISYTSVPPIACFWVLIVFIIPAIICSIFLLYNFLFDRKLRTSLNNHVIVALLTVGIIYLLIDMPQYLNFIRIGYVWPSALATCYFWCLIDLACYNMLGFLMTWASIERHILVFHNSWVNTSRQRFFFHYLPLITIFVYSLIFYIVVIFFPPCENDFDYTRSWCNYPCYFNEYSIMLYDTVFNCILPIPLIAIINVLLIIRVIRQRQVLHQNIEWRKFRKMIIQIIAFSSLFIIFSLPMMTLTLAHLCGLPYEATAEIELSFYYIAYFINIFLPFVCLGSLPKILMRIKRHLPYMNATRIDPTVITLRHIDHSTMKNRRIGEK